jgi:glycogen(starch) synthase
VKILVVTNLYPPQHIGGYELGCRDVVEKLRARGHAVRVLTSSFRHGETKFPAAETDVERNLQFNSRASDSPHDKRAECHKLTQAIKKNLPDAIYFWNQAGLSFWLAAAARWHGCRIAFFLSDPNFVSWRVGAWLAKISRGEGIFSRWVRSLFGKTILVRGKSILQNESCHFASEFLRQVAVNNKISVSRNSIVAHWGIEPAQFPAERRARWPVRRLLYVGQLIPQKGVHTAIAALGLLAQEKNFSEISLTIVGGGLLPEYEKELRELPVQLGIENRIHFSGKIPRAELPRIYAEHDVLIFPSEWDEPFAITPLEAMASGLAVIGTTTGGSRELFRDRETALTFRAGDAVDCARAIRELCTDPKLFEKISRDGQREVGAKHTLDAMVDRIEKSLQEIVMPSHAYNCSVYTSRSVP